MVYAAWLVSIYLVDTNWIWSLIIILVINSTLLVWLLLKIHIFLTVVVV